MKKIKGLFFVGNGKKTMFKTAAFTAVAANSFK